jgi:hypothetical protein
LVSSHLKIKQYVAHENGDFPESWAVPGRCFMRHLKYIFQLKACFVARF